MYYMGLNIWQHNLPWQQGLLFNVTQQTENCISSFPDGRKSCAVIVVQTTENIILISLFSTGVTPITNLRVIVYTHETAGLVCQNWIISLSEMKHLMLSLIHFSAKKSFKHLSIWNSIEKYVSLSLNWLSVRFYLIWNRCRHCNNI